MALGSVYQSASGEVFGSVGELIPFSQLNWCNGFILNLKKCAARVFKKSGQVPQYRRCLLLPPGRTLRVAYAGKLSRSARFSVRVHPRGIPLALLPRRALVLENLTPTITPI